MIKDFKLTSGTTIYPFAQTVPFPLGCIGQLRIALKNSFQVPYVTAVASAQGYFSLQIQTKSTYLGNFIYQDDLWITLDNQNIFGFLQLLSVPNKTFSYSGTWPLQRCCYTFPIQLKGDNIAAAVKDVKAEGRSAAHRGTLNLSIAGDLTTREGGNSNIINIGRDLSTHQDYTQQDIVSNTYITAVNGIQAKYLTIGSSDPSIQIEGPIKKANNVYVLYIGTTQKFPMCSQWLSDSTD